MFKPLSLIMAFSLSAVISNVTTQASTPADPFADTTTIGDVDEILDLVVAGQLAEATEALANLESQRALQPNEQFLGAMVEYLAATERFSQAIYAHGGLVGRTIVVPFPSAGGDPNPYPQRISYRMIRLVIETLRSDLESIDAKLSAIDSEDWKLPIRAFAIRLDLDGDGSLEDEETLATIVSNAVFAINDLGRAEREIAFDQTDVHWLRTQCLFLSAACDFFLAHDFESSWHILGPLAFANTDSPYQEFLSKARTEPFLEAIAAIHMMRWEVIDASSMHSCRNKLLEMCRQLTLAVETAERETDNDREWYPSTKQESIIHTFNTTHQSVENLKTISEMMIRLLEGETLLPLIYQGVGTLISADGESAWGVNLRSYFENPSTFDLLLMIHGTGATDYLEEGRIESQFWMQFVRGAYQDGFEGFGIQLY